MKNLHYATVITEAHAVRVTTWDDADGTGYKMTVDGRVLDEGRLDDASEASV